MPREAVLAAVVDEPEIEQVVLDEEPYVVDEATEKQRERAMLESYRSSRVAAS